jgi:toxin ParE1/3/4
VELRWTPAALDDLDQAGRFIAEDSPADAVRVSERVLEAAEALVMLPTLGRAGRVRTTRELVISGTPFILVYRVRLDEIQILRVLHHARRWPAD